MIRSDLLNHSKNLHNTAGVHKSSAVKLIFFTVVPNMFGSSIRNLFHVTFLVPRILRWFHYFWNMFGPMNYSIAVEGHLKIRITLDELHQ